MLHSDLHAPQVHAAEHLLIADPTVASELVAVAVSGYSSRATQNSFRQILLRHGHHDDVATIDAHVGEQIRRWDLTAMLPDFDDESHLAFYGVFDEWERAPLSAPQSVTASELASLLQ
ncbi:hypothetical protein, partial [Burkholderia sp. SIMBA_024]|uniref:hypothetical protein n=1 Tax=Burkholderia sp. SIMBA_024 TaxID=3085768 RepID=UPI00397E7928